MSNQQYTVNIRRLIGFILLLLIGAGFIVMLCITSEWIDRAKLVLSLVMLAATAGGLFVVLRQQEIHQNLVRLEMLAEQKRDDAMFEFTALRSRLAALADRMTRPPRGNRNQFNKELVEHAGSALMLVIQQETHWLKWSWWATRLAASAWDYFVRRSKA